MAATTIAIEIRSAAAATAVGVGVVPIMSCARAIRASHPAIEAFIGAHDHCSRPRAASHARYGPAPYATNPTAKTHEAAAIADVNARQRRVASSHNATTPRNGFTLIAIPKETAPAVQRSRRQLVHAKISSGHSSQLT